MLTVSVTEWEIEPLVAVTVMVYVPIGVLCCVLILSVEVLCPPGVRATDELLSVVLGPEVGETTVERVTVPENPFRLLSVIRLVPEAPRGRVSDDGLMEMEKSDTMTRTETECVSDPLVPVTVNV